MTSSNYYIISYYSIVYPIVLYCVYVVYQYTYHIYNYTYIIYYHVHTRHHAQILKSQCALFVLNKSSHKKCHQMQKDSISETVIDEWTTIIVYNCDMSRAVALGMIRRELPRTKLRTGKLEHKLKTKSLCAQLLRDPHSLTVSRGKQTSGFQTNKIQQVHKKI